MRSADAADYAAHLDCVHFNPVRHGLVAVPADWPYSTFRACVRRGLYPVDWIGTGVLDIPAGEPGR
jgi:REP-associated tyrosine transposase